MINPNNFDDGRLVELTLRCPVCGNKNTITTSLSNRYCTRDMFWFSFDDDKAICECGTEIILSTDENSPSNDVYVRERR